MGPAAGPGRHHLSAGDVVVLDASIPSTGRGASRRRAVVRRDLRDGEGGDLGHVNLGAATMAFAPGAPPRPDARPGMSCRLVDQPGPGTSSADRPPAGPTASLGHASSRRTWRQSNGFRIRYSGWRLRRRCPSVSFCTRRWTLSTQRFPMAQTRDRLTRPRRSRPLNAAQPRRIRLGRPYA